MSVNDRVWSLMTNVKGLEIDSLGSSALKGVEIKMGTLIDWDNLCDDLLFLINNSKRKEVIINHANIERVDLGDRKLNKIHKTLWKDIETRLKMKLKGKNLSELSYMELTVMESSVLRAFNAFAYILDATSSIDFDNRDSMIEVRDDLAIRMENDELNCFILAWIHQYHDDITNVLIDYERNENKDNRDMRVVKDVIGRDIMAKITKGIVSMGGTREDSVKTILDGLVRSTTTKKWLVEVRDNYEEKIIEFQDTINK